MGGEGGGKWEGGREKGREIWKGNWERKLGREVGREVGSEVDIESTNRKLELNTGIKRGNGVINQEASGLYCNNRNINYIILA